MALDEPRNEDEVIEENGALYLMGACGNSATEYMGFYVTPKEKEGFQIAKIKDGKMEYIKAFTKKEAEAATQRRALRLAQIQGRGQLTRTGPAFPQPALLIVQR